MLRSPTSMINKNSRGSMWSPPLIPRPSNICAPILSKIIIFLWWTIRSSPSRRTLENQPPDSVVWSKTVTWITCSHRSTSPKSSNLVKNRPWRNNRTARMMEKGKGYPHLPKQKWGMRRHKTNITPSGVSLILIRIWPSKCLRSPALWKTAWV